MGKERAGRVNLLSWHGVNWQAMRERDRINDRRTTLWSFAWVASLALSRVAIVVGRLPQALHWLLVAFSLAVGIQFVRSYLRMVREADELLRQVQLEGLAVGFGAGLIGGFTVICLIPPSAWWAMAILMPMTVGYLVRVIWAARTAASDAE